MKVLRLRTGSVLSFEVEKPPHPAPWIYGDSDVPWNSKCSTDNSWHYISMSNVCATAFIRWFHSHFLILVICYCSSTCKQLVNLDQCCFQLHMETTSRSQMRIFFAFFLTFVWYFPFTHQKRCLHHFILVRKQWKVSLIVSQSPRWPSGMSVYVIQTHQNAKRFSFFMWCKTEKGWCERLGPENVWTSCFVSSSCNYWVF